MRRHVIAMVLCSVCVKLQFVQVEWSWSMWLWSVSRRLSS